MDFEWNEAKAASNLRKHRVTFHEAATIFDDPMAVTIEDPDHSDEEDRSFTIGYSLQNRLLLIAHTERNEAIRIISARSATRLERQLYED